MTGTPIRELPVERSPEPLRGLLEQLAGPAAMASILISGGRKDKVRPGDIVGALTGEAGGLQGSAIGKIEVLDRFSYVAVEHPLARLAVERLNQGRIKGKRFRATLTPSDA
ncbi:MAG: DbpA RNA binding domain-containing protein [Planctomycetota bacterium]|nr:DbpA RNA binding domain-containing protein [Planctomycetota bacterium]